ncbi:MAG TPA: endonuclease domain-containing protein [Bacteroidales bacterium]|nr:endonuclease domain-containing protein [Bacteroidales bacterium]
MKYPEIKQIADRLRKNQTPEEKKLWEQLRKHQIHGRKFLRQHVIIYESKDNKHFFFIPDFYCARERLIVEVDGKIHDYQKDRDRNRDEILKAKGLRILRFKNEELDDLGQVLSKIEKMFRRD